MNKKWILQIYSLFLMFLISLSSFAGVSSVGNGGGLSEMHFIYFFQNSRPFLISLQQHEIVKKSESLQKDFSKLLSGLALIQKESHLTFSSDLGGLPFQIKSTEITVSSQQLYDGENLRPLPMILSRAFALQMVLVLKDDSRYFELVGVFGQMLRGLKFEHALVPFEFDQSLLRLSDLKFEWESHQQRVLSLEDAQKTHDLTEKLQRELPCAGAGSWDFSQWKTIKQMQKRFLFADARGRCGENDFEKGKTEIRFEVDDQGFVIPDLVQIRFLIDL